MKATSNGNGSLFPDNTPEPPAKYVPAFGPVEKVVEKLTKDPWEIKSVVRVWSYYCRKTERGRLYMATPKRMKAGLARLRDCVTAAGDRERGLQMMRIAVDNLAEDEFLSGKNDRNTEYRDFYDHLMKSWEVLEKRLRAK